MKRLLLSLLSLPLLLVAVINLPPATAYAAGCDASFFGLPSWYKYLEKDEETQPNGELDCEVKGSGPNGEIDWASDGGRVALAIVEILIRIGTLVAVGFVIYGGFRYITSQGEPENTKSARQTILNAVIGLVICLVATGAVAFITNAFLDLQ